MIKNKDQTFYKRSKRFLWPVTLRKFSYFKYFIKAFLVGVNLVIHVLFLEKIIEAVELSDKMFFNDILIIYTIYIFLFEIINFTIKKWGWMNVMPQGIADIYNKYLHNYLTLDNNKVDLIGTGKIIGIIQQGSHSWVQLLSNFLEKGTALFVSLLFTIYMVSRVELYYGVIFLFLMIFFFYLSKKANDQLQTFRKVRYELRNTRLKYLVKILMSKMEILQANRMDSEMRHMYENAEGISNVSKEMSKYREILKRTSQFGISLLLLGSFWYFGNSVLDGEIKLSVLVGLTGTLIIIQKTISEFISFYVEFCKDFVNIDKLWNFFDSTPQMTGYEEGDCFVHKKGEIIINQLIYGYDKEKPVFNNFDLIISGEKVTALVGNSGSGKTTLIKLLSGYITPDSGDIIVDDQKISEVSLKSYYSDIGYLTQEPSVFDGSILDNLTYAIQRKLEEGELDQILQLAKCEFIYDLPQGIHTEIGERGIRLSGGQRQRLAIAKIFLKDPKIILLDEPTSALDSFSEELITKAMHNLFQGRTIVIIAHRLQTVKNADDIILLSNGEIKERGTHKNLVHQNGIYKKMLDLQTGF